MKTLLMLFAAVMAIPLSAGEADGNRLQLTLPRIDVAEYHRPYVAIWLRNLDSGAIHNIAVWYQLGRGGADQAGDKGEQWLKDMRQWWRYSGRRLAMPIDGISGATRPPGDYSLALSPLLASLTPGQYVLNVEAAREVGGREMLQIPFSLPVSEPAVLSKQGDSELGKLELYLAP